MTKICGLCKNEKSLVDYNKHSKRKDGLQSFCRDCGHKKFKDYYANNKEKQKATVVRRNRRIREENRLQLCAVLRGQKCIDCGEADPVVLDFDHVRGKKRKDVTLMVNSGFSWKNIVKEIAKCEVRCSNCHRRRTAKMFRHKRWVHFSTITHP